MKPYIEFVGSLQNSGFWLVKVVECPEGPSTQYSRAPVPKTSKGMVFGTRDLKCWVLGPSGI